MNWRRELISWSIAIVIIFAAAWIASSLGL